MGETFRGGFGNFGSGDNDPSNGGEAGDTLSSDEPDKVVDFNEWRRSHGYAAPEEATPNETVSESAEPSTAPETTNTMTADNRDQLLVGQVKVEKASLLTVEGLLKIGKHFFSALMSRGNLPPEMTQFFDIVADEVLDSEPVKSFAKKIDDFEFDDFMIERQQKKMARENNQPKADQA